MPDTPYMPVPMDALKDAVLEAARKANDLRDEEMHANGKVAVEIKPDGSKRTRGDWESENILRGKLPALAPGSFFLGEEGNPNDANRVKGKRWVVDPIDGTSKYIDRQGRWAVSVAYQEDGVTKAAAVYVASKEDGRKGTLYSSVKGMGAFAEEVEGGHRVEGTRRRLSLMGRASQASVPVGIGFFCDDSPDKRYDGNKHTGHVYNTVAEAAHNSTGVEPVPVTCACADALSVLEGKTSAYAHGIHFAWDSAAISLIIHEAGYPSSEYKTTDPRVTTFITARSKDLFSKLDNTYRNTSKSVEPSANYASQLQEKQQAGAQLVR
jgi:myo-inositol-1(or 4)-monophosphatase